MNKKTRQIGKIHLWLIIIFCFFLYTPTFKSFPLASYIAQYIIPTLYVIINIKYLRKLPIKTALLLLLCGVLVILSLIVPVLLRTNDFSYLNTTTFVFRKTPIYLFLIILLIKKYDRKSAIEHFLYYYAVSNAIYVFVTIALATIAPLNQLWFSVFSYGSQTEKLLTNYGYTFRIGWLGFSGFRFTMYCSFSCIFLLYLRYSEKKCISKKQFFIPFIFCFLGNMFYGRSGLIVTILATLIMIGVLNRKKLKNILLFSAIAAMSLFFIYSLRNLPVFSSWYNWASTPIVNFVSTGNFDNYSYNHMNEMLFMPEADTLLHGDGYFTYNGRYYMRTDLGIMRNILFWGIIGALLSYTVTVISISGFRKRDLVTFLIILLAAIIFEYKGDVYYEILSFALPLTAFSAIKNNMLLEMAND